MYGIAPAPVALDTHGQHGPAALALLHGALEVQPDLARVQLFEAMG